MRIFSFANSVIALRTFLQLIPTVKLTITIRMISGVFLGRFCSDRGMEAKLPFLIMTDRQTDRLTNRPNNQPTDKRTDRVIGKLHFQ